MRTEAAGHAERIDEIRLAVDGKDDRILVAGQHGKRKIELRRAMARKGDEAVGDELSAECEEDAFALHAFTFPAPCRLLRLFSRQLRKKWASPEFYAKFCLRLDTVILFEVSSVACTAPLSSENTHYSEQLIFGTFFPDRWKRTGTRGKKAIFPTGSDRQADMSAGT